MFKRFFIAHASSEELKVAYVILHNCLPPIVPKLLRYNTSVDLGYLALDRFLGFMHIYFVDSYSSTTIEIKINTQNPKEEVLLQGTAFVQVNKWATTLDFKKMVYNTILCFILVFASRFNIYFMRNFSCPLKCNILLPINHNKMLSN